MKMAFEEHYSINRQRLWVAVLALAILATGTAFGGWLLQQLNYAFPDASFEPHLTILITVAIFMLASAIPFVPGAEIGFGLMVMFGGRVIILVYICMVIALLTSFLAGRFLPFSMITKMFSYLGIVRAQKYVTGFHEMEIDGRFKLLIDKAPGKIMPVLAGHRCLAIMILLNLPGNSLLGGGGGIAFACGMSGLFTPLKFTLIVAAAVAPVPLLLILAM